MTLKPLAGYCLIEPLDEEQTTASGLVMPDKEKEKPAKGKLVALSPIVPIDSRDALLLDDNTTWTQELRKLKVGDIVIFHKWAGQDVKEDNKEYRLVKFSDLMGVYE